MTQLSGRRKAAAVIVPLLMAAALFAGSGGPAPDKLPTVVAEVRSFTDTLVESGTLGSAHLRLYSSTLGGPAKLLELIPEGSTVRAGDVLARLDTTMFEQARVREEAALQQAQAEVTRAREEAIVEGLKGEGDADAAEHETRKAEEALSNQRDGRGLVDVLAAETAAAEAGRVLDDARTARDDMKPLLQEGFVTRAELDRADQALRRAEDQRRLAVSRLEALIKHERPAALARAAADVISARANNGRQSAAVTARLRERRAQLALASSRASEIGARLAILHEQTLRGVIRADAPGLVVYREIYFGSDQRKPSVGDEIMPAQPILAVPDMARITVDTRVREVDLHRVARARSVTVRVEAYPDVRLRASVTLVGALAQQDAARAGTRFFPVTVTLDETDARLRTGMTARVEIEIASIDGLVVVPARAVFGEHGSTYVLLVQGGTTARRQVTVAASSESLCAISAGLRPGDRVSLVDATATPPK